jgi:hypothetical protein
MKRKQFMSKLAALGMAAMMTATAIPASAMSVFAGTATDTTSSPTAASTGIASALTSATETNDGKDLTASDIDKLLASDTYSTITQSLTKTKDASYDGSAYTPSEYTGTMNVTTTADNKTETVSFTYKRNNYSNQDQLDAAAAYITSQFDALYNITSTAKDSTIKNLVSTYLKTFNGVSAFNSTTDSVTNSLAGADVTLGAVNVTTNNDSTIAGTVTINIDDPSDDGTAVLSKTVNFSIAKEATVPTAPETATASEFANSAVAKLASYDGFTNQNVFGTAGKPGSAASDMTTTVASKNIATALDAALGTGSGKAYTISGINIINVTPAEHAAPGTIQGSFTVTKASDSTTATVVFTASIQHSFADIVYEANSLATTALNGISATDIQAKNSDTAVTIDEADAIVTAALDKAFAEDYDTGVSVASELGKYEINSTLSAPRSRWYRNLHCD